jgi:hypothetical protein
LATSIPEFVQDSLSDLLLGATNFMASESIKKGKAHFLATPDGVFSESHG